MTSAELRDNLTYLSALGMLSRLVDEKLLTETEALAAQEELRRRLCPSV